MEKVFITRVLPGLLALVMVASIQVANLTGAQLREIHSAIDITIDRRGNPTDPPLFVGGIVTLHIDSKEGSFTGTITPGFGFTPGSLPGTQGVPLTSVQVH